jgi:hypothetical protein
MSKVREAQDRLKHFPADLHAEDRAPKDSEEHNKYHLRDRQRVHQMSRPSIEFPEAQRIGFDPLRGSMADKPHWTEPPDSEHESLGFVINAVMRKGGLARISKHSRAYIDFSGDPGAGSGR